MKVSPRRKTMKWKRRKKGKAKGFQRRQPLERFPNIKEKGLQRVLLIWYLCSPSPCPQACSSWCTKGSCSPRTAPCPHILPASSSDSLTLALHTHHSSFAVVEARWDWAGSPQSQRVPAGLYPRAWLLLHPACRYRWAPLFCPSSWGTCLALSHSPTSAHSHFPSAGQHFCFPPSILFLFLFAPFSCPSLPCLCIFAEVQGRCLLYFPCLQSTLTPSCLELPRAGCREHTSQVRRGRLQLSVDCNCQSIDDCQFPLLSPVTGRSSWQQTPLLPTRDCCYLRANSGFPHPGHCRQHLPVQHCRGFASVATSFTE